MTHCLSLKSLKFPILGVESVLQLTRLLGFYIDYIVFEQLVSCVQYVTFLSNVDLFIYFYRPQLNFVRYEIRNR